ncbi:hypothetical protein [Bacteroides sp.]|jgi:hypothetical protein|uniref:hypothetical protein n=1 Tax=Bacteroides sp. TaxID=29523 RepID=UPI003AB3CE08
MNCLQNLYQRIEYLRNSGVKMKEIADWIDMPPSVLSSLYTTVLPNYFNNLKTYPPEEALEQALVLVNNVSKKRLLNSIDNTIARLNELEPDIQTNPKDNIFAWQFQEEMLHSVQRVDSIKGIYISYSLSSSSDYLKVEPFLIALSENKEYIRIGRLSAYKDIQWGFGIIGDSQNMYCFFNENEPPHFTPVTVYLQLPLFHQPKQLRGLYLGLDYNRNPVARRIVLVKESESTNFEEFANMRSGLVPQEELSPEEQAYYDYTCQEGDVIKMCTVPSLQMNENDLIKEKKMLAL